MSVHDEKCRASRMRLTRATGSCRPEVARDRWHRSRTAWRGASAAPSSRAVSRSGARTPAPVSSVTLGPDRVPVRRAASVPGSCSSRCPLAKVFWAWPTPDPLERGQHHRGVAVPPVPPDPRGVDPGGEQRLAGVGEAFEPHQGPVEGGGVGPGQPRRVELGHHRFEDPEDRLQPGPEARPRTGIRTGTSTRTGPATTNAPSIPTPASGHPPTPTRDTRLPARRAVPPVVASVTVVMAPCSQGGVTSRQGRHQDISRYVRWQYRAECRHSVHPTPWSRRPPWRRRDRRAWSRRTFIAQELVWLRSGGESVPAP